MKTKTAWFLYFAVFLFFCAFQLAGCQLPKNTAKKATAPAQRTTAINQTAPVIQESWQTISNQWASIPLETIKQAAETNEVTAQYYLAIVYSDGVRVSKGEVEAFKWMKLAAEQGMARAQRKLGGMYQNGSGVETEVTNAFAWFQKAAQQGDALAQANLGWAYENGAGVSEQFLEAIKWYQKSAEQGELFAEKRLAKIYAQGAYGEGMVNGQGADAQIRSGGVAPNHELAEMWMQKAIDLNSAEGQCEYGELLYDEFDSHGFQDTSKFPAAGEWYRKAAEQGYAKAQYELAEMYNAGQLGEDQRSNCIPWYLKAAAQNNAQAQAVVGELPKFYPNNELLKSVNTIEALQRGAENGDFVAQYQLARRYQAGDGVANDVGEAFKWMQKAVQNSQTSDSRVGDALYALGLMYEKGEGVTQDLAAARSLFVQAQDGYLLPEAAFRVGQMYERGDGVLQDDHKAAEFYANKYRCIQIDCLKKYPNGYVEYAMPNDLGFESLLRLWSQNRGFPDEKDKSEPGYREAVDLIKSWERLTKTAKAQFYAGKIYFAAKVVPQDLVEADAWFQLAADQEADEARMSLNEVELKMSSAQKEAAKNRCAILKKEIDQEKMMDELNKKVKANMPWW
jgi:TPR repeat protein